MGLGPIRSDGSLRAGPTKEVLDALAKQPDPKNFTIKRNYYNGSYSACLANYPNCTNYEGNKIIVMKGLPDATELDPHFSETGDILARFEPTALGWGLACDLVDRLVVTL